MGLITLTQKTIILFLLNVLFFLVEFKLQISADMVANANLAAMSKHAGKHGVKVYQVTSSVVNPITIQEFLKIIFKHFKCNPYIHRKGNPVKLLKQLTCINTMENRL